MKRMDEEKLNRMAEFIRRYIDDNNGDSPKFKDIIEYMGMNNSVGYRYLTTLRDRGIVTYNGRESLTLSDIDKPKVDFGRVEILGFIPCGFEVDYRQEVQGYVALPKEWLKGDCYLLRTTGDSMVDIGINDGDLVLIQRTHEAVDGQVVAVLTENGTTLKRFQCPENGRPWLLAENKTYPENKRKMYPNRIEIQGIALKVIKDIH